MENTHYIDLRPEMSEIKEMIQSESPITDIEYNFFISLLKSKIGNEQIFVEVFRSYGLVLCDLFRHKGDYRAYLKELKTLSHLSGISLRKTKKKVWDRLDNYFPFAIESNEFKIIGSYVYIYDTKFNKYFILYVD